MDEKIIINEFEVSFHLIFCAVLPIENSHNGDVGQVLDLAFFGSLFISGVYEIEVIQNLLGIGIKMKI